MNGESPEKSCVLPPWLWFWVIFYLAILLPYEINYWKSVYKDLSYGFDSSTLTNIPELLPSFALFFGVISIFFPHIRAFLLERKFKLVENESVLPKLPERIKQTAIEIENFLKLHAPNLQIKINFNLFTQNCFLYASGYHKTTIALFGGILRLWRSDRKVAESILLHEIGHYRNGDGFIIGAGSFFEWVLRYCLIITTFFFIIPLIQAIAISFYNILDFSFSTVIFMFEYLLLIILTLLFAALWALIFTITTFIPPIAGIWCAELNADRFMRRESVFPDDPARTLDRISEDMSIFRWLISQVSHPPKWFRKWAIKEDKKAESIVVFLLLFPLASLITLTEIIFRILVYSSSGNTYYDALERLDASAGNYLHAVLYKEWFLSAFFILLWPFISIYWVKFFSGKVELPNWENYKEYILSAGIVFCLFITKYFS